MTRAPTRTVSHRGAVLLERDVELDRIGAALEATRGGTGALLRLDGAAGIGKTRLLAEVASRARDSGLTVLRASGGELERGFPFGVVRQLFEPCLAEMSSRRRDALLTDAAALAAPLFGRLPSRAPEGDRSFAVLHGLYWLTAKLTARSPLALLVDDAHWADPPSTRFIDYLARRLNDIPVALVVAWRPNEPGADPALQQMWDEVTPLLAIALAPLSANAAAALVRETLDAKASADLCDACYAATGGNPFYLRELIAGLLERRDGQTWSADEIGRVTTERVSRAVRRRLASLGPDAEALARGLAVLPQGSELRIASALTDLDADHATAAADALRAVGIVAGRPPDFVHPIVRAAALAGLSSGQRARLHARAAEELARDGADPVDVGAHLLEVEPGGRAQAVTRLRLAAQAAIERGAPGSAVAFLRRAEREPPAPEDRPTLLFELGQAELLHGEPAARDNLAAALSLTADPVEAARIALPLGEAFIHTGALVDGARMAETVLDRLEDRDRELAARLELFVGWVRLFDARLAAGLDQRLPRVRTIAEAGGPGARPLLLLLGAVAALRAGHQSEVLSLIRRGLDNGRFVAEEGCDSHAAVLPLVSLLLVDALDDLERLTRELQRDARRRGSVLGQTQSSVFRGWAELQRGSLAEGLADTRAALALAQEHQFLGFVLTTLGRSGEAICELDKGRRAISALDSVELGGLEPTAAGCGLLYGRGVARARLGRRDEAADDLRHCGATLDAIEWRNPNIFPWRSALAGLIWSDQLDEAQELVAEELRLARISGQPRAIGCALHARALLGDPVDVEGLRAAVGELESSPARLELARALTDLGAALRRANHRAQAREPLRRALDLAHACGAVTSANRAREELVAAGGRPRRMAAHGADALTPSERRVSRLAAEGLSNPEIAQTLFVSRKAVEMHLSHAYSKLDIHSRTELSEALQPSGPGAPKT
jgi:DNA-binding CsgD family transcriptional regulator